MRCAPSPFWHPVVVSYVVCIHRTCNFERAGARNRITQSARRSILVFCDQKRADDGVQAAINPLPCRWGTRRRNGDDKRRRLKCSRRPARRDVIRVVGHSACFALCCGGLFDITIEVII